MRVRVTLVAEPDGDRFHAYCAELTGVHADGDTEEDAFRRIRQAGKTHLQALKLVKRKTGVYMPDSHRSGTL